MHQERLQRKFTHAYSEVFPQLEREEREALKKTYLNSIHNSKTVKLPDKPRILKGTKRVSFVLENNVSHWLI